MEKILMTGANGALGRAVCAFYENSSPPGVDIIKAIRRRDLGKRRGYACDLERPDDVLKAIGDIAPDLIIHMVGTRANDFTECYANNVETARNILEAIRALKSSARVILIGSAAEYGVVDPEENPIKESRDLKPVSSYGVSKAWQSMLVHYYYLMGVDVICARAFNLFGPGMSDQLFPGRLQKQIDRVKAGEIDTIEVGSLAAVRDYVSTEEAARQIDLIVRFGVSGQIYHVGSGIPVTMRQFMMEQLALNGVADVPVNEAKEFTNRQGYDVPVIYADMSKTFALR